MINVPSCNGNAMICINNLPEHRILNELCVFTYLLPCTLAACPEYPLGGLTPREHRSHFHPWENPKCVDNEGLDGENWSQKGEGKWKRALRKTFFSWVHLGPSILAVTSLDIWAALSLKQALLRTLLCCVLGDLQSQAERRSWAARMWGTKTLSTAKGTGTGFARNEGLLFVVSALGPCAVAAN